MFTTPHRQFLFVSIASFIDFTLDAKYAIQTKKKLCWKVSNVGLQFKIPILENFKYGY
jgi:hypothetical protein